jgi:hypothetical protein
MIGCSSADQDKYFAKNSNGSVSYCRRDLQLLAATFIAVLKGEVYERGPETSHSLPVIIDQPVNLDCVAHELFASVHENSELQDDSVLEVEDTESTELSIHSLKFKNSTLDIYMNMPQQYRELLKLLWKLQSLKGFTAKTALESKIFESLKKLDALRLDPWRQSEVPNWNLLPYIVVQSLWRRTIIPRCQHYYVKGGPYHAGDNIVLELRAVWLIYERTLESTGNDSWQRTVRLAQHGNKGDTVGVYVCPIVTSSAIDFQCRDCRWMMTIKNVDDCLFNGKTCGKFNPLIAIERQQIGCYINSSKDKQNSNNVASLRHDLRRKSCGRSKGENCAINYPHGWHQGMNIDKFEKKPWLGTICFKLTLDQPMYTELAYSYDWYKRHRERQSHFMTKDESIPNVRMSPMGTTNIETGIKPCPL